MSGHLCSQGRGREDEASRKRRIYHRSRLVCVFRSRTRHVTEKAQWSGEQKPSPNRPLPVGAVRFNFASDPDQYFVVTDVPWLLERLRASGTNTATADFDMYCTWRGKVADEQGLAKNAL